MGARSNELGFISMGGCGDAAECKRTLAIAARLVMKGSIISTGKCNVLRRNAAHGGSLW